MVQKVVAGVGALFTAIGLIMLIVISVTEDFVIVVIPNSTCTDDNPLGTLGVFTATFTPECVGVTDNAALANYAGFDKAESNTVDFWPLFPAQNNFGDAFGELPAFTTCEEFYNQPELTRTAVSVAAAQTLPGLEANIQKAARDVTGLGTALFGALPGGVDFFSAFAFESGIGQAITSTKTSIAGINAALVDLRNILAGAGCVPSSATLAFPEYTGCPAGTFGSPFVPDTQGQLVAAFGAIASATGTGFGASVVAALGGGNATIGAARLGAVVGPIALHFGGSVVALTPAINPGTVTAAGYADLLFGGANTLDATVNTTDFGLFRSVANALATAAGGGNAELNSLAFILNYCTAEDSVDACISNGHTLITPTLLNDAVPLNLCILGLQDPLILGPALAVDGRVVANCTYPAVLLALGNIPAATLQPLLGLVPAFAPLASQITDPVLAGLKDALTGCSAFPLSLSGCRDGLLSPPGDTLTFADENGTMSYSWTAPALLACVGVQLQGGSCPTPDVRGLVNATITNPATAAATAGALNGIFNGVCRPGIADTNAACLAHIATGTVDAGWVPLAGGVLSNIPGVEANLADRIAGCEDDETDKAIFQTAQAMIPAAMALAGIAMIAAIAAAALNKTPIVAVAALLSLAAGGITIGALLYIRTAPVYELVGGDPVDDVPLYKASGGQLLGLLGGVLPLLGGVAMIVSAFLNRPGSSSEMTSKVDNTY